ncbi:hypothetical protein FIBSPDRAFT_738416 [Athelia psychrophila]|uniref:BHLH domain-containing protein n=1 Tax=Athelia psychrophila TaxID=1759441 RepID=A0A166LC71_9AGAM|nr:hypothetical protein FIBSPDRAFT_738416 [Fibularhizoctonia sp. CBS 109695]
MQSNKRPRPTPSQGHASTSSLHKIKPSQSSQSSQSSRSLHSRQSPTSPASALTPTGSSSLHRVNSAGTSQGHHGGAGGAGGPAQKPALLSSSQKKANHIQSEQKRRANIRRGYEALCEAVPALREAIALEDAQGPPQAQADERRGGSASAKGKGKGKAGDDAGDKEKMDGRAGPRSENVVLQKTIDHIQDLLQDKSDLLARLHSARAHLPPHQQNQNQSPWGMGAGAGEMPLWERAWTGGVGAGDDDDEGEDD